MNKGTIKVAVKNLLKTEQNKENVIKILGDEEMLIIEVTKKLGTCKFTAQQALRLLLEDGYVVRRSIKVKGAINHLYKASGKPFVKKTYEELESNYSLPEKNQYYGADRFWMPWMPVIPQGSQPKTFKLFEQKDNEYFHAPLRKNHATGIGSTFSLYEDFAL